MGSSIESRVESGERKSMQSLPQSCAAPPVVNWTAGQLLLIFWLHLACSLLVFVIFRQSGLIQIACGDEVLEAIRQPDSGPEAELAGIRVGLWVSCLALVPQLLLALAVVRLGGATRLADVGLTVRGLAQQVKAGLLFAAIFAPGAYGIQAVAMMAHQALGGTAEPHPFSKVGGAGLPPLEWGLLIGSAVLVAPLWEEFFYRGLVQPWVIDRGAVGGGLALLAAAVLTVLSRERSLLAALKGEQPLWLELIPVAVLGLAAVVYALLLRRSPSEPAAGLFASAVLFAWIHARVWPSPVPLLWLALGLGWLRWRSGSLVGPIVCHAAFNAIACAAMLWHQ
jgi:membrane protease YdiL (CAAX protease family)